MKFHVGQQLILHNRRGTEDVTVSRVGRKYVYITQYGRECKFHGDTGQEVSEYGSPGVLYTPEEWAKRERRLTLFKSLDKLGIEVKYSHRSLMGTDVLEQILAAVVHGGRS
ncbi:hypothetical protein SEA_TYPHA_60 [Mycobacterium phage Typha]|uniref:Uncharacterized protein n=1 Tax=Mycobacterium phage Typha TaxID=2517971 RepID=A0A482JAN6_9CAUD|nr:hypothetical protein KCH40_gp109 [Mycobacterium phage Typha]QBP29715.1 hypothetical protein SEA_TYPHA_60 [Mycobacterium phage Typha]